jgi:spiro-SPASM protein
VLIETDGSLVDAGIVSRLKSIAENAPQRANGHEKIYWIVYIDAMDKTMYSRMHANTAENAPTFPKALEALDTLTSAFGKAVYPQFMRTTENEEQLEAFYRTYKEKGNLIIQKSDSFCGKLPDMRPADLAPLVRYPCWHLVRDMVIFPDGSVPMCRECVLDTDGSGGLNVFSDGLAAVWEKTGKETTLCKDCDEYYTFNF